MKAVTVPEEKIPLLVPDLPPYEELAVLFRQIVDSGIYSNFGPLVRRLESELGSGFAVRPVKSCRPHAITTASGTAAIEVALQSLSLRPGAKILVPAFGFAATPVAAVRLGFEVVFADVDGLQWELTPEIADAVLEAQDIDLVIVVSPFGYPLDLEQWRVWSARTQIPVVADVAAGLGNQEFCADIPMIFSLHATKPLGVGEGGVVVASDDDTADRMRRLTNFGFDGRVSGCIGGNAKMSEWHAAVGISQLGRIDEIKQWRGDLLQEFSKIIAGCKTISCHPDAFNIPLPAFMPICVDNSGRAELLGKRLADSGIDSRRWFYPALPEHPVFARRMSNRPPSRASFGAANSLAERIVCLPFHRKLGAMELARIRAVVEEVDRG